MSVQIEYGPGGDPVKWFRGKIQQLEADQEAILERSMDEGAILMKEYISTRGTAKGGARPDNPGRIDTERMLKAVESNVTPYGPKRVRGTFGWLSDKADYFKWQEGGFDHVLSGEYIEGMYAMQDAADWALRQYKEDMDEVMKRG